MASPSISINPQTQTNFAGSFFVTSDGFTQGDALDDPAIRFSLRKGIVSPSVTQPMWGGLAISETMPAGLSGSPAISDDLESILAPATSLTGGAAGCLTGFTVFNQATAMIQSAQSRVPMSGAGMAINFYRLGSKARIPLQALSTAATAWAGGVVDPTTVYWDTNNLWLTNASGSGIIGPISGVLIEHINSGNSRVVSYNSTTNFANWTETGYTAVLVI